MWTEGRQSSSFVENSPKKANIIGQFAKHLDAVCCQHHFSGSDRTSLYINMRAFSISKENSERGMLKAVNYVARSENKGETGSKQI